MAELILQRVDRLCVIEFLYFVHIDSSNGLLPIVWRKPLAAWRLEDVMERSDSLGNGRLAGVEFGLHESGDKLVELGSELWVRCVFSTLRSPVRLSIVNDLCDLHSIGPRLPDLSE